MNWTIHNGWDDERTERLKALWSSGHSASQVARLIGGVTRNAVIGKVNRLGMQRSLPTEPRRTKPVRKTPNRVHAPASTSMPKLRTIMATTEPRPWLTRQFGECAYPVSGLGADTYSCCAPTGGDTYCAAHRAVMYDRRSATQKQAAADHAAKARAGKLRKAA